MIPNLILTSYKNNKITINLEGGTLLAWVNDGQEVFYQGSTLKRSGVPILFPFANPLENGIFNKSGLPIAQHGFARNCLWKQVLPNSNASNLDLETNFNDNTSTDVKSLEKLSGENNSPTLLHIILSNQDISPEMQLAYPYNFLAEIIVDISIANSLIYTLKVTNNGENNLPIAPGLHPYFPINHEDKSKLRISSQFSKNLEMESNNEDKQRSFTSSELKVESDINNLVWSGENVDWNGFSKEIFNDFSGQVAVTFPDKTITITEASSNMEIQNLVIWSQTTEQPDYNFICIEPFTRGTNAINDNPIIVEPGKTWEMKVQFKITV